MVGDGEAWTGNANFPQTRTCAPAKSVMNRNQLALFNEQTADRAPHSEARPFADELRAFTWDGKRTLEQTTTAAFQGRPVEVPQLMNEFWTSRQRAAHSLH